MNTASHDLSRHLGVLHDRLMDPTHFEQALFYFLEEFAGDVGFLQESHVDEAPHLRAAVRWVAAEMTGEKVTLEESSALCLPEFGFFHGQAWAAGRVVLFFYYAKSNLGLAALMSGGTCLNCVARFQLPECVSLDPKCNSAKRFLPVSNQHQGVPPHHGTPIQSMSIKGKDLNEYGSCPRRGRVSQSRTK